MAAILPGHLRARCSGPGSALEAYVRIWIIFTFKAAVEIDTNFQHRTVDPSRDQRNAGSLPLGLERFQTGVISS